jgi:hypothetical protein
METSPTKEDYKKFQRHLDGLSDRAIADRRYQADWGNYDPTDPRTVAGRCGQPTANSLRARPSGTVESSG